MALRCGAIAARGIVEDTMKAMDVMVRDVVTVKPETDVATAIKLLVEHDISALPVVDQTGTVIGVISEADLVQRAEIGTEKQRPWWLEALTPGVHPGGRIFQVARADRRRDHVAPRRFGIRRYLARKNRRAAGKAPHQARSHHQGWQAGRHREPIEPDSSVGVGFAAAA
jgi:hypothetical protein